MSGEEAGGIGGSLCAICCATTLTAWCNLKPTGARCCGSNNQSGCCGSCFDSGFQEDSWDKEAKKEEERQAARVAARQLQPTEPMSRP
ncbi:hypothetical protein K523DRAFT_324240 [Schizophyllum commune Tattone D]|nr:hypothetical protein K523DRAFT_324240 [Schizophyllum commune Tattone D]